MMNKCFGCIRRLRFMIRTKKQNKKWLHYIENYCSHHTKDQWCDLLAEHYDQIRKFDNASEQILRQLRSTNISTEIIKVIRKDYVKKLTPFCTIVEIFGSYINHRYFDVVNPTHVTISKIVTDCENFTDFLRSLYVIYYQLQERELIGDDQFFRVTLTNFISECLFQRENFYNCITQVIKNSSKQAQDRVSFNIQKFQSLKIQDYEVNPRFSLDERTLKEAGVQSQIPLQKPYIGPIQMVKEIIKVRTPAQKMKCLQNLISQLEFALKKFYETHNITKAITLDADNAISILLYIIVQSEQAQLLTHINLISNFMNKQSLSGSSGYCLATLRACMQFLEKGNIKRSKGLMIPENQFSLWINVHSYFEQSSNNKL